MTAPQWQPPAPPAPRKNRAALIIGIVIAALMALCLIGGLIAAFNAGDEPLRATGDQDAANRAAASQQAATPPPATTAPAPATTAPTTAPTTTAPTKTTPPAVRISDGTYMAGEDTPAGRYKVTARADEYCYWSVTTAGGDIIDNHLGGGYPQFTAKKGQMIEIARCGEFELID